MRRARVVSAAAGLALGIAVAGAAPAAADETAYLNVLMPRYVYLDEQQVIAEGYKVCEAMERGVGASEIVPMVQRDLKVPAATAVDIVSAAAASFGC